MVVASPSRLLIAGCGALGNGLARRLPGSAWQVYGLRRNTAALDAAVRPIAGDLTDSGRLPPLPAADAVIYTATPASRDPQAYRQAYVDGLRNVMGRLPQPPRRLIYVSSTSVLADDQGAWVDETTPPRPPTATAEILREGELLAREHGAVILRFAGIYGPGRMWLIRQAQAADLSCVIDPPQWANRIHAYDCVTALQHLLTLDTVADVYHGVDDLPAPRHEVLAWLREQLGLPPPQIATAAPGTTAGGKRVSNQRLRASGWQPDYPDYRHGYREILAAL